MVDEKIPFLRILIARYPIILLAIVLSGGLLARLYGIGHGLPDLYNVDEPLLVNKAAAILKNRDLNPHWFDWPGTTILYMMAGLLVAIFLVGRGVGVFESVEDFRELFHQDPTVFYLSGRVMLAVFGVVSILVAYAIARRLFNRPIALVAATLFALSPLHVFHAKLIRPDVLLTFLVLVAFWFCLQILQQGAWSDYVLGGFFTGLAVATKYPGALVAPIIVMAHLSSRPWRVAEVSKLLVAGVACVLGTFVGSPFLFLDYRTALSHVVAQNRPAHVSATGEGFLQNFVWYIQGPLVEALSIAGLLLAALGVVLCLASRQREKWLLVAFPVLFTAFTASLNLRWERWIIPVVPFLCILAAFAWHWTATKTGTHRGYGWWVGCLLLLATAVPLLKADLWQGRERAGAETRAIAKEWMLEHIPPGARVLLEASTPQLPKDQYEFLQVRDGLLVEIDAAAARAARFRPRGILGQLNDVEAIHEKNVEYMVLSNFYDRYLAERETYAEIVATYEALMSMGIKIHEIRAVPGENDGPTIRVYRLDRRESQKSR